MPAPYRQRGFQAAPGHSRLSADGARHDTRFDRRFRDALVPARRFACLTRTGTRQPSANYLSRAPIYGSAILSLTGSKPGRARSRAATPSSGAAGPVCGPPGRTRAAPLRLRTRIAGATAGSVDAALGAAAISRCDVGRHRSCTSFPAGMCLNIPEPRPGKHRLQAPARFPTLRPVPTRRAAPGVRQGSGPGCLQRRGGWTHDRSRSAETGECGPVQASLDARPGDPPHRREPRSPAAAAHDARNPMKPTTHGCGDPAAYASRSLADADPAVREALDDETRRQRVQTAPASRLLLPWWHRIGGKPVAGSTAEVRLGGRHLDGVGLLLGHE